MPKPTDQHETGFDSLPPAIIDALREMDGPAVLPDPIRDADVLSGARRHLNETMPVKRNRMRLFIAGSAGGALAAAAVLGIAVLIGDPTGQNEPTEPGGLAMSDAMPATTSVPFLIGDINESGDVDILDAYALARRIERGQIADRYDFDQDGSVDQRDIDWIAHRAVALPSGEQG